MANNLKLIMAYTHLTKINELNKEDQISLYLLLIGGGQGKLFWLDFEEKFSISAYTISFKQWLLHNPSLSYYGYVTGLASWVAERNKKNATW